MAGNSSNNQSPSDAQATRKVQEFLEQGCQIGFAIDSNFFITKGGGTLDVSFRSKIASWEGKIIHLAPTVWEREIKRHLRNRIESTKERVFNVSEKDVSLLGSSVAVKALCDLRAQVGAVSAKNLANSLWASFVLETHAISVAVPDDGATAVLDWYFEQRLPFEGAGDKKHEFPDAFALHALESYAKENGIKVVVVVTKDSGAYGHCASTERLIAFRDIQSALGSFEVRELIDRRRIISQKLTILMQGARLRELMERLVNTINRPYEHQQQPWVAMTTPDFPQNPRIKIDEVRKVELVPFGNFGLPINATSIASSPLEGEFVGVFRMRVKLDLMVSCEISARDKSNPENRLLRQIVPISSPVEREVIFDFALVYQPIVDSSPESEENWVLSGGLLNGGILSIEIDPLPVSIPDNYEYRAFA